MVVYRYLQGIRLVLLFATFVNLQYGNGKFFGVRKNENGFSVAAMYSLCRVFYKEYGHRGEFLFPFFLDCRCSLL